MQIVEQRSDEWFKIRRGKITSSEIHKIMGKDELSDTAKTYLLEKISEYFGGAASSASGPALDWGIEWEPTAVDVYAKYTNTVVDKASFIVHSDHYGGSPDGLVAPDGIIEVKCPYTSVKHFKHGLIVSDATFKKIASDYYYQCISNMICANAKWCDFISFDPRVDGQYTMFIYRLHRNEDEVKNMLAKVENAAKHMQELKQQIENINNKQILTEDVS